MTIIDVQTVLTTVGFSTKGIDGLAGPNTYQAVEAFQKSKGLKADGVLRWETLKALFPAYPWSPVLSLRAMEIACTQVGVREEDGANNGLMVDVYQRAVGISVGDSYCMAFVVWCYDQAADSLGVANPLIRTGGCLDQLARVNKSLVEQQPQVGDIGIIDEGQGHGHTFIVTMLLSAELVSTVEANTNDNGSSNGNGDYFRTRSIKQAKAYIRASLTGSLN